MFQIIAQIGWEVEKKNLYLVNVISNEQSNPARLARLLINQGQTPVRGHFLPPFPCLTPSKASRLGCYL